MPLLLEVKVIGSSWVPRRILEEDRLKDALEHLYLEKGYTDWRIRRIHDYEVVDINAQILIRWP